MWSVKTITWLIDLCTSTSYQPKEIYVDLLHKYMVNVELIHYFNVYHSHELSIDICFVQK